MQHVSYSTLDLLVLVEHLKRQSQANDFLLLPVKWTGCFVFLIIEPSWRWLIITFPQMLNNSFKLCLYLLKCVNSKQTLFIILGKSTIVFSPWLLSWLSFFSSAEELILRGQAPAPSSQVDRAGQPDQQLHGLRGRAPAVLQSHHQRSQQPLHTRWEV